MEILVYRKGSHRIQENLTAADLPELLEDPSAVIWVDMESPTEADEQIMLDVKSRGWVRSIPGRDGGFVLGRDPSEITMGEVVRHFDGVLAPIACVSTSHYEPCSQESVCRFRRVMLDIRNYIAKLMDQASLESVFAGPVVKREEVFATQFASGEGI